MTKGGEVFFDIISTITAMSDYAMVSPYIKTPAASGRTSIDAEAPPWLYGAASVAYAVAIVVC